MAYCFTYYCLFSSFIQTQIDYYHKKGSHCLPFFFAFLINFPDKPNKKCSYLALVFFFATLFNHIDLFIKNFSTGFPLKCFKKVCNLYLRRSLNAKRKISCFFEFYHFWFTFILNLFR